MYKIIKSVSITLLFGLLFGCGSDQGGAQQQSLQENNNVPNTAVQNVVELGVTATAAPKTLDVLAHGCNARWVDGLLVQFRPTTLPSDMDITSSEICDAAKVMVEKAIKTSREVIDRNCSVADNVVVERGFGSYEDALHWVLSFEPDSKEVVYVANLMKMCIPNNREKLLKEVVGDIPQAIYSVGTFVQDGKSCRGYLYGGYLYEGTKKEPFSKWYGLSGYGGCEEFSMTDEGDNVFHPVHNPNGTPLGDVLRNKYKYSGQLPVTYTYKKQVYKFVSDPLG